MLAALTQLPLVVTLLGVSGLLMLVPAAHALVSGEGRVAEVFFAYAGLTEMLALLIGIAMAGRRRSEHPRRHLVSLIVLFVGLPFLLALPFHEAVRTTTMTNAYVEMVSSLTTTGASLFDEPGRIVPSLHLWRATVGWLGGLIMWVAAIAVLAPMSLGGFEVRLRQPDQMGEGKGFEQITKRADLSQRVRTFSTQLGPLYLGLTLALWVGLLLGGETPMVGLAHAMSTLATSGISPVGGIQNGTSGYGGEVMVAIFFVFAISRLSFAREGQGADLDALRADPEIRIAVAIMLMVPAFLFARHFVGAIEVDGPELSPRDGLASLWGAIFTVGSFLTTTGFESAAWSRAGDWSGISAPGIILIGLALIGGGVATTAGGVKLLRIYALYQHGARELARLVHPHSIGGAGGQSGRMMRRRGAYMAWLFIMLMTLSAGVIMLAFSLTGQSFERALILTVASLTTTGPLALVAGETPILYATLPETAKWVLAAAMVLGRLESLAIVALFTPDLWRR